MSLARELWFFLFMVALGSFLFVAGGDYGFIETEKRVSNRFQDPANLGLDIYIAVRAHLFGLFLAFIGFIGIAERTKNLVKCREKREKTSQILHS